MRDVTIGGRLDRAHPSAAPHAAAFEVYRQALIAGKLPATIARDRVAGRLVRDWGAAWASPPVPDEVVDVGLALIELEDGRFDVLEFTTRESGPPCVPHDRHGWFEAAAVVAAPGWAAAWSYRQRRTARRDRRPPAVEQVVVGMRCHPDLWRLTRHHAAAPIFVAGRVPAMTPSPSPRSPAVSRAQRELRGRGEAGCSPGSTGGRTDTFRRLVRVPVGGVGPVRPSERRSQA